MHGVGTDRCSCCVSDHPNSQLREDGQADPSRSLQALIGVFPAKLREEGLKEEKPFLCRREGGKQPVGCGRGERTSKGLALVQNEDKWAVSSGEYILSLEHLPLHQGPTQACQAGTVLLCLCRLRSRCHGDGAISHVCCCCTEAL